MARVLEGCRLGGRGHTLGTGPSRVGEPLLKITWWDVGTESRDVGGPGPGHVT